MIVLDADKCKLLMSFCIRPLAPLPVHLGKVLPEGEKGVGDMEAEIKVYLAELKDVGKAAALFNQYRQFYQREDDIHGAEQFIKERLTRRDSVIYLADWNQHGISVPAGFVQLYPTLSSLSLSKLWILNDLYVDAKYRGRGIGRKLLHQARMNAVLTEAKGLNLSTQHHNLAAQRLYESEGYVKDDEFIAYYLDL